MTLEDQNENVQNQLNLINLNVKKLRWSKSALRTNTTNVEP